MRTRRAGALSAMLLVLAVAASGCGDSAPYENADRPPAVITIGVNVTDTGVAVSPARIGAGPTVLLIANSSSRSREVTLTTARGADTSCVEADASSGPINPQGNASLQLPLVQGVCEIGVAGGSLRSARLIVGAERESAQQDLLQP